MPASGTSVAARIPPPRRFENYILTRVVDPSAGLTEFKDADFAQLNGNPDYTGYTIGQGFCDDGYSFVYPIGFDFQIDGITYKQFVCNANGWMVLVDPTLGSFNPSEVISGAPWQNSTINPTFTSKAVLLAPWFDDLRNVAEVAAKLTGSPTNYSTTKANRIAAGLEPRPTQLDGVAYGVSFRNDSRSTKGRRLIIRWNSLSNYAAPSTVLKFEVVIYENGIIEYRYASRANLALFGGQTPEGATIGIFMPNGTYRFRDFAIGLGYRDEARQEYQYGGYIYTQNYTDSYAPFQEDYPSTAAYTINLTPAKFWPGLTFGGSVFTFSPPVNRRKVLPRLAIRTQDSKLVLPTVARTGDSRLGNDGIYYDDRKSPTYSSLQSVGQQQLGVQLNGLEWLLPRLSDASSAAYNCPGTVTTSTTLGGDPSTIFNVTLRFRGVVEAKSYSGGTPVDSFFQIGGTPSATTYNTYSLTVSNPAQTYYLNRHPEVQAVYGIDYTETIPIAGGATITLTAFSGGDAQEWANNAVNGGPISVPGITTPAQPYQGQFIIMNYVGSSILSSSNIPYVTSSLIVNYPTTLPRFFGGTGQGTFERQNLFSGDMLVTGAISNSAIEPYVNEGPTKRINAFNEAHRHEQDESTLSSQFYTTGSNFNYVGAGFDQPLKSKTQVRVQLPVDLSVQLPPSTSSIFYYNQRARCWEVPANSTYVTANGGTVPPSPPIPAGGDWKDPTVDAGQNRIIEDSKGFGAYGQAVSSGSHTPSASTDQTDVAWGVNALYNQRNAISALSKTYTKSIRNNEEYRPTLDETFTLPITAPFLIEKMVIELPMAMGSGWFQDITQCGLMVPHSSGSDIGGPALTVAVHHQIQLAENNAAPSVRDLILTGTIIPSGDNFKALVLQNFPPYDSTFQLRPRGFLSFANPPGAVVSPGAGNQFTGSVKVQCESLNAAGLTVDLTYFTNFLTTSSVANASGVLSLMGTPTVPIGGTAYIAEVSPMGRGGFGVQQAGRSILGNEFVTFQGLTDPSGLTVPNPFYTGSLTPQMQATLKSPPGGFQCIPHANVPMISHFPSPYLVMPGDKLVLSISKKRPLVYGTGQGGSPSEFSGSYQHDVQLLTGSINITFYGSQVAEGVEYHDTLNQPLASDVCHELVGADAVLDQFEPSYRNEYSGSFTDNVMLGTLLTSQITNGRLTFVSGTRDRKISALGAVLSSSIFVDRRTGDVVHDVYRVNGNNIAGFPSPLPNETLITSNPSTLSLNWTDALTNSSKAYRAKPWVEQVGSVRLSQFVDDSERYWDSLMPDVHQCFAADGCGIFITRYGAFGNAQQVNAVTSSWVGQPQMGNYLPPGSMPLGWIWFDFQRPDLIDQPTGTSIAPLVNSNWTKAYPFEPRYQGASRQLDVSKGLVATYLYQPLVQAAGNPPGPLNITVPAGNPLVQPIAPTQVGGFMFGPVQQATSVTSTIVSYSYIQFWIYIFGFWFFILIPVANQGLVYTVSDICNTWLADCQVGPSASFSSSIGYYNQYGYFSTGSATIDDISRALFGFGDSNSYFQYTNADTSVSLLGTGHYADFRDQEGPHPNGTGINGVDNNMFKYSPRIRGWKYGVISGVPLFSKAYWRRNKYGQFRDMLEQRPFTKYYESPENGPSDPSFQQGVKEAAVTVKFLSPDGRLTGPDNTWSSNLSFECTSSLPYIEGVPTNRPVINPLTLNKHIISFRQDFFGNLRL